MALKACLYGIRVGNDFVPCELDCELNVTRDMINKSGSAYGSYRHYRYGYISWTITCNARAVVSVLNSSFNNLLRSQLSGQEIEVYISARQSNTVNIDIGGTVLIPSQTLNFGNSGFANHSITFQGTGILNDYVEEFGLIINAMPAYADKPIVVDASKW